MAPARKACKQEMDKLAQLVRTQLQSYLVNFCAELNPALGADVTAGDSAMGALPPPVQPLAHLLILDDCQDSLPGGLIRQQPLLRQDRLRADLLSQSITGDKHHVRGVVLQSSAALASPASWGIDTQSSRMLSLLGSLIPFLERYMSM